MTLRQRIALIAVFVSMILGGAVFAPGQPAHPINPKGGIAWPSNCGVGSQNVYNVVTGLCQSNGTAANPAGSSGQAQFNFGGSFSGSPYLIFDSSGKLNLIGNVNTGITLANYGAVSDAQSVTDGAISSGSHTLTSASALFTPSTCGAGKVISVQYAGGTASSNQPLVTTCTYVSATQVTLVAAATQAASSAGVIWGTDNLAAFQAWAAALPGHAGIIPAGNFLINAQVNTQQIILGSNETIRMDRNGSIYYVGASLSSGLSLFKIPAGTSNLVIDGFNVIGEWQNTSTFTGAQEGFGYASFFQFENTSTASHDVIFSNGKFNNMMGIVVQAFGVNDYNIAVYKNTIKDEINEGFNINTDKSTVSENYIEHSLTCVEDSGAQSQIINNKCLNSHGFYGFQFGGRTSGSPYSGVVASGNIVDGSSIFSGCFSIGDGLTQSTFANNQCLGLTKNGSFGFVEAYQGFVAVGNNSYIGNTITGSNLLATAFYENQATTGSLFRNNITTGVAGLTVNATTGVDSAQNHWNNIALQNGSTARLQESLTQTNYSVSGGSSVTADTVIYGPLGLIYSGPPPSIFSSTVQAPDYYTQGNASSGAAANSPAFSGSSGYWNFMSHAVGASPDCHEFGAVNSGSNNARTWECAEYNSNFSSNYALFVAKDGNTALNPIDALRAWTVKPAGSNTYVYGWLKGSMHVGATSHDPGVGSVEYEVGLLGPASAPTLGSGCASPATTGIWVYSRDGKGRYCDGSIWLDPFASFVQTICSGTIALSTGAITLGSSVDNTATCTGLLTTDNIVVDYNGDPTAVAGYGPAGDILTISKYPAANMIHVKQSNNANNSGSITPGAVTVNYHVFR